MYEFHATLRSRNRQDPHGPGSFIDSKAHVGLNLQKAHRRPMHKNAQNRPMRSPGTEPRASATGLAGPSAARENSDG
jgi:hypothetical protein